jgi:8-oxo-dGTP diphosphatase
MVIKNGYKKVVIAFLHNNFHSYLLQLRDFKSSIIDPGHWGLFGGSIEEGESPRAGLCRELTEEIGYSPEAFNFFREDYKTESRVKLNIHMFYASIDASLGQMNLMEGADIGVFTKDEILTKSLFSAKFDKSFPIVPLLSELFDDFFEHVDKNIKVN